jgi:nucleoid-associated protein YgaU
MQVNKPVQVNYRAYTLLLLRQKFLYILTGFIFVAIVSSFILVRYIIRPQTSSNKKTSPPTVKIKTYTVKEGEDLWQIAEKAYGSGYNAYDIAKANNLSEPYILQEGQILKIPDVKKRFPTQGEITSTAAATSKSVITGSAYTVQEGDYLFNIAERVYGDGNLMWKIIQENSLTEPYNVEVGQILQIPR